MQTNKMTYVHCAIVFVFAFFFRFVPPIGQITPYGMGILGTFIAAIYGWSTIGMVWPSFICLTAIGISVGPNMMIASGFNATILAMIFVFLLMALLEETGATTWLVNTILGSKFTMGKPWLTLFLLFVAAFIGGILNSMVMAVVFVGVFTTLCKNLNMTPPNLPDAGYSIVPADGADFDSCNGECDDDYGYLQRNVPRTFEFAAVYAVYDSNGLPDDGNLCNGYAFCIAC